MSSQTFRTSKIQNFILHQSALLDNYKNMLDKAKLEHEMKKEEAESYIDNPLLYQVYVSKADMLYASVRYWEGTIEMMETMLKDLTKTFDL